MSEQEFRETLTTVRAQVERDAAQGKRCADELRWIEHRSPRAVESALDLHSGSASALVATPASAATARHPMVMRSLREIERRQRTFGGDVRTIADAIVSGPAALERVWSAAAQAQRVRMGLCQSRDAASTLATMMHEDAGVALSAGP